MMNAIKMTLEREENTELLIALAADRQSRFAGRGGVNKQSN